MVRIPYWLRNRIELCRAQIESGSLSKRRVAESIGCSEETVRLVLLGEKPLQPATQRAAPRPPAQRPAAVLKGRQRPDLKRLVRVATRYFADDAYMQLLVVVAGSKDGYTRHAVARALGIGWDDVLALWGRWERLQSEQAEQVAADVLAVRVIARDLEEAAAA